MRISLVVPTYDEESVIGRCLEAVARQTRPFDEVLIVDNNSSDSTLAVVAEFAGVLPIRVLSEARQGVAWAKQTGFDAATGDVIGRIDADTVLDAGWAQSVVDYLGDHPDVDGLGGLTYFYDMPFGGGERRVRDLAARYGSTSSGKTTGLAGNNSAIRRAAWELARPWIRNHPGTHEDADMSTALGLAGCRLQRLPAMIAAISPRRYLASPASNATYLAAKVRSKAVHGEIGRAVLVAAGLPLDVLHFAVVGLVARSGRARTTRRSPVT